MIHRPVRKSLVYELAMLAGCLGLFGLKTPTSEAEELRSPARIAVFLVAFSPTDRKPQEFRLGLR